MAEAQTPEQRTKQILEAADQPLSTNEVADQLEVSWNTAADTLQTLETRGDAYRHDRNNRLTLWWDRDIPL